MSQDQEIQTVVTKGMRLNERKTKKKGLSEKERERVIKRKGEILEKEVGEGRKSRGDKIKRSKRRRQGRRESRDRRQQRECCVSWLSLFTVTGTGGG